MSQSAGATCLIASVGWSPNLFEVLAISPVMDSAGSIIICLKFTCRIQCTHTPHAYSTEYAYFTAMGLHTITTLYIMVKPFCKYRGHVGTVSHVYSVWKPLTLLDMASCHRCKVPSLYGATSTMERAGPCFRDDGSENV